MLFNAWLLGWSEDHFSAVFVGISLLFGLGYTLMCLMVREGHYPPPPALAPGERVSFWHAVRAFFRECFALRYYRALFVAMLLASVVFMPFNTFSLPYAKSLNMPVERYGGLIAFSYGISLLLAYPLGWIVDRLHPLRMGIATMAIYAIATAYGAVAATEAGPFAVALVAHTVLSGAYFTSTAGLGAMLFPRSSFAQFSSAAGIVGSLGTILLGFIVGPLLDLTDGAYRLTFVLGLLLCAMALAMLLVVYQQFMVLGGPKRYVAPVVPIGA
jgi:MFS family permease